MTKPYGPAWRLAYNRRRAEILAAGTQTNGPAIEWKGASSGRMPGTPGTLTEVDRTPLNVIQFKPRSTE